MDPKTYPFPEITYYLQMAFIQIKTAGGLFITNEYKYCATIDALEHSWFDGVIKHLP